MALATSTIAMLILGGLGFSVHEILSFVKSGKETDVRKALKKMDIEQIAKQMKLGAKEQVMKREAAKQWLAEQKAKEKGAIKARTGRQRAALMTGTPGVPPEQGGQPSVMPLLASSQATRTLLDLDF